MRIVTVGREFGSGGREVGKRLADELGFHYYDKEIITEIAKRTQLDENYVETKLEKGLDSNFHITYSHTFMYPYSPMQNDIKILISERQIIKELAAAGRDFVIVGRNADILLAEYKPFNIFVYADSDSKVARCRARADASEKLSDRELKKQIRKIDSNRAKHRELLTNSKWGSKEAYHLCVNTTNITIKDIIPVIGAYASTWFEKHGL